MLKFDRILVPVDFSPDSMQALHYAVALAKKLKGPQLVVALHVVDEGLPTFLESRSVGSLSASEHEKELEKLTREQLTKWINDIVPGEETIEPAVIIGKPASSMICRYAGKRGFDVIVIGNQGRGALRRLVLGSTVQQVQRVAPCPVLAVKDPANWMGEAGGAC